MSDSNVGPHSSNRRPTGARAAVPNFSWENYTPARVRKLYGAGLFVLVLFASLTLIGFQDTAASSGWVDHTYQVIDSIENFGAAITELESDQRAYVITRDSAFLNDFSATQAQLIRDLDGFKRLTIDNLNQTRNFQTLLPLVQRRTGGLQKTVRLLQQKKLDGRALQARIESGRKLKDQIRNQIDLMRTEEYRLLARRVANTDFRAKLAFAAFAATGVSALLLLTGVQSLVLTLLRSFAESREQQDTYSRRLEEEVERTATARKELERSNRELQDFAFVASHDLQEPLRKIRSYGERLKNRLGPSLDEVSATDVKRIQSAAERMQGLINDLLALSRVSSKAQPFVTVDLNVVFDEVMDDLETRIKQSEADVRRGELPVLKADPLQMRQLVQNLVGNALKFSRSGVRPEIVVSRLQSPPPGMVGLVVQDNGIGFEAKHAEKIFTVFQRLHARTEYEGSGVGLAICRRIVERHGGAISASGVPGEGAKFTVTLPRGSAKTPPRG